jgi:hypothetical protein
MENVVVPAYRPTPRTSSAEFHQPHEDMSQRPWSVALPPLSPSLLSDTIRRLGYPIRIDEAGRVVVDLGGGSASSWCTAVCDGSSITLSAGRGSGDSPMRYRHERATLVFLRSLGEALHSIDQGSADVVSDEVSRHEAIFDRSDRGLRGNLCWSADKPDMVVRTAQRGTPLGLMLTTSDPDVVRHLELAASWLTVRHTMWTSKKKPPTYTLSRPLTFRRSDGTTIPLIRYGPSSSAPTSSEHNMSLASSWSWGTSYTSAQLADGRHQVYSVLTGAIVNEGFVQHGAELMALWNTWLWLVCSVDPDVEVSHIALR